MANTPRTEIFLPSKHVIFPKINFSFLRTLAKRLFNRIIAFSFRVGFIYIQKLKDYLDYSTLLDKLQVNNFAFPRVSPTLNLSVMPADTKYAGTHIIQGRICAMWSAELLAIFMPA